MMYWFWVHRQCSCQCPHAAHSSCWQCPSYNTGEMLLSFILLSWNKNKATFWICRWWPWHPSFCSAWSWSWPAFQSKFMNFLLMQSRKTQSRWIFIIVKWKFEIVDNSALIHSPFHLVTSKTTTLTIDRIIHIQAKPDALDNTSWIGDEATFVSNQQSMLTLWNIVAMVKSNNCHNSTNC